MIKRENIYKFLYCIDILLIIGFCIRVGVDYYKYRREMSSAPFYIFIIVRTVEFFIAALIIFIAAEVIKRHTKK